MFAVITAEMERQVLKMKELVIRAVTDNLQQVLTFVEEQLGSCRCPTRTLIQLKVAVEEVFVNIASYAYEGKTGDAAIRMEIAGDPPVVTLVFEDCGMPFNPLAREDPDVTLPAGERQPGNLGIYIVKKTMDDVKYEYADGKNILTLRKQL